MVDRETAYQKLNIYKDSTPFCGQPNPQGFFFCTWCGERFPPIADTAAAETAAPETTVAFTGGRITKPFPELEETVDEKGKP